MVKCPKCNTELSRVVINSTCWQYSTIDGDGMIDDYGCIEEIGNTISINCPDCDLDITALIKY